MGERGRHAARGQIHVGNEYGTCELVHFTASVAYVVTSIDVRAGTYARVSITPPDQPPVDFDGIVFGVGAQDGQQLLELRLHEPGPLAVEVLSRLLGTTASRPAVPSRAGEEPAAASPSSTPTPAPAATPSGASASTPTPDAVSAPSAGTAASPRVGSSTSTPTPRATPCVETPTPPPPARVALDGLVAGASVSSSRPTPPPTTTRAREMRAAIARENTSALDVRVLAVFLGRRLITLHPLGRATTSIGRSSESGIVLDDATVSRKHCRIVRRDEECWLVDEGAANRTLLNGGPVQRGQLAPGDEVTLGKFLLIFMPTRRQLARSGVEPLPRDGNSQEQTLPLDERELEQLWTRVADERRAHLRRLDGEGQETGAAMVLTGKRVVFGRGAKADVQLTGWLRVRREHAALVRVGTGRKELHRLEVTGGGGGVTLNGEPLRRSPVLDNEDVVAFGEHRFRYYQSVARTADDEKETPPDV